MSGRRAAAPIVHSTSACASSTAALRLKRSGWPLVVDDGQHTRSGKAKFARTCECWDGRTMSGRQTFEGRHAHHSAVCVRRWMVALDAGGCRHSRLTFDSALIVVRLGLDFGSIGSTGHRLTQESGDSAASGTSGTWKPLARARNGVGDSRSHGGVVCVCVELHGVVRAADSVRAFWGATRRGALARQGSRRRGGTGVGDGTRTHGILLGREGPNH